VDGFRFSPDGRVTASGDSDAPTVGVSGSGVVDATRRPMSARARARRTTGSAHLTGHTAYTECARVCWTREDVTRPTPWLECTPHGRRLALRDRSSVHWRGTDAVDGTESAVVTARPTDRERRSLADARGAGGPTRTTGPSGAPP
jgi:hypothetical protein